MIITTINKDKIIERDLFGIFLITNIYINVILYIKIHYFCLVCLGKKNL